MTPAARRRRRARGGNGGPDPASSILKIKGTEMQQAITELLLEVVGPYALPEPRAGEEGCNEPPVGPEWAHDAGARTTSTCARSRSTAASNEIQRNIIAKAILGL